MDTAKRKRKYLKIVLASLACIICIWAIKIVTVGTGSTEAAVLSQVVKIMPNSADAHFFLGVAYFDSEKYEEAIAAYKDALNLDSNHSQAHFGLAKAYLKMGNRDLALQEYEILKKLDPKLAEELLGGLENG